MFDLNKNTIEECYNKYLINEIKLFNPELLLALGREVERFLVKKKDEHKLPVIYIKHPSYYYKKTDEEKIYRLVNRDNYPYFRTCPR